MWSTTVVSDTDEPTRMPESPQEQEDSSSTLKEAVNLTPAREPSLPAMVSDASELRQEFESLLAAAERLQESCDRLQGRVELVNMAVIVLLAVLVLASIYVGQTINWTFGGVCIFLAILLFGALQSMLQAATKRRLERDRRALDALAQLLRETETSFLLQGVMGTLEIAQFKIRMARFDIRAK
ncbi:hypothetical protein WME99_21020 [Sorangium sp. So ce136]|uniref:hypothetical protein n=1 Tax=Sorangium sp. So ce136 TaxID=3133284 RepID=UPI003F024B4A